MTNKIPWITEAEDSKFQLSLPIDAKAMARFLELEQNNDGFYNTLEETFWAVISLKKVNFLPETQYKKLISFVLRHRIHSGGYSNRIKGTNADLWSTFYAIALLYITNVFSERIVDEKLFCPECGQRQLFKGEQCFNCEALLIPEKRPCILCSRVVSGSPSRLCETCQENLSEDIEFILSLQKNRGFLHCEFEKCIDCKGKPSYKSTFFAINTLKILKSIDKLDMKSLLSSLKRDQYIQEIERVFQVLSYILIKEEGNSDFHSLLQNIIPFQHKNSGFGIAKKVPVVSDTFWCVSAFYLLDQLNLIHLGGIYTFLLGLTRNDGGYSEQIMDTSSNILSTVQSHLIFLTIFDPLVEHLEELILKQSISEYKIFLDPITEKVSVSSGFIEYVAYHLLSKDWYPGKILDQLNFFNEHLDQSNKITYDVGKSLIQTIQNQNLTELNLTEFSKRFPFENAEERVKTAVLDFISRKYLEGKVQEIKKTFKKYFVFSDIKLPRKFIALQLDNPIPVDKVFKEKGLSKNNRKEIEEAFQSLLELPETLEHEILNWLDKKEIKQARERLEQGKADILEQIDKFDKTLTEIISKFEYIDFKGSIHEFTADWSSNKETLKIYMDKFQERITVLIDNKEQDKEHEETLTNEQRIISNFEHYLGQITDKVELLSNDLEKTFQQNYKNQQTAQTKINTYNKTINSLTHDLSEKFSQFSKSLELSQLSQEITVAKNLVNSKIDDLKQLSAEIADILATREKIPQGINEKISTFKGQLEANQKIVVEKIENKEFDLASKELETLDDILTAFITETPQELEKEIESSIFKISHFNITFNEFRTMLSKELKQLEVEWTSQKAELLTRFHEKTELTKKAELKKRLKKFITDQTDKFDALKQHIELLIKHENVSEAKSKMETKISQFLQTANNFQTEINDFIKDVSKSYKTFKKLVVTIITKWENDKNFIQESMQTLLNQLNRLSVEKDLVTQKNKLGLIIKNQKMMITKSFSNLMRLYNDSLEDAKILAQEQTFTTDFKNIRTLIKKASSQIDSFIKENSKKFLDFVEFSENKVQLWAKTITVTETALLKLEANLSENLLIERIYYVIKAFEGHRTDLKYLSKAVNIKSSQLKDKLVHLISNSRLDGNLDPINDILTISALEPIIDDTQKFLEQIKKEIGEVLQIDYLKKEEIPKAIEDKKQYLLQLRYLLIIHREIGSALFHRKLGSWELNPDLISGFITAIGSFGTEIKSKSVPIQKMAYQEFEILLNQGEHVLSALILNGTSSKWHEKKLAQLTKEFEKEFEENLKQWSGELTQFKSAGLMVDRVFELFRAYI